MKPLVIYHKNCADGFGAAYAAWKFFGDDAEYVAMHYGDPLPPVNDREVYVLDFSFPRDVTDQIIASAHSFTWLDHHKTAFENWCAAERDYYHDEGFDHYILLHNRKSGALLAWEFFHKNVPAPMVIRHIDDRDRWVWAMRCSREVHAAINAMQPWTFEQWDTEVIPDDCYGSLVTNGGAVLRTLDAQIQGSVSKAWECCIVLDKRPVPHPVAYGRVVNCSLNISEVGNELAKASGTFGLVWYYDPKEKLANCSLRSIGDYDVSEIAKLFGGGGHKNAAGFRVPMNVLLEFMA